MTGPEALGLDEAAEILSEAAGRPVSYEPVSDEEFRELLLADGWSPGEVKAILRLFASVRKGGRAPVLPELEQVLGRPPRTLRAFAQENAAVWA